MKKNLVFATKKHQTLPFRIAGRLFWSKRLTGEEELLMADLAAEQADAILTAQATQMTELLDSRKQDQNGDPVTTAWTLANVGVSTMTAMVQFFRTGERPADYQGESFDLPEWGEPFEIGDGDDVRTFKSRAASFAEQIRLSLSSPDGEDPSTAQVVGNITDVVAEWLNARRGDSPEIDTTWLLHHLQIAEVTLIMTYLSTGDIPEGDDPNAESNSEATLSA